MLCHLSLGSSDLVRPNERLCKFEETNSWPMLRLLWLCRNAYANYYQYIGQKLFLQSLKANGSSQHVVFMDMDVLVVDSILEVFCGDFGYGLTINANEFDPVDIGLQFVQSQHYSEGIGFLQVSLPALCHMAGRALPSSVVWYESGLFSHSIFTAWHGLTRIPKLGMQRPLRLYCNQYPVQ